MIPSWLVDDKISSHDKIMVHKAITSRLELYTKLTLTLFELSDVIADSWTTKVWTVQVHNYVFFFLFSIVSSILWRDLLLVESTNVELQIWREPGMCRNPLYKEETIHYMYIFHEEGRCPEVPCFSGVNIIMLLWKHNESEYLGMFRCLCFAKLPTEDNHS